MSKSLDLLRTDLQCNDWVLTQLIVQLLLHAPHSWWWGLPLQGHGGRHFWAWKGVYSVSNVVVCSTTWQCTKLHFVGQTKNLCAVMSTRFFSAHFFGQTKNLCAVMSTRLSPAHFVGQTKNLCAVMSTRFSPAYLCLCHACAFCMQGVGGRCCFVVTIAQAKHAKHTSMYDFARSRRIAKRKG